MHLTMMHVLLLLLLLPLKIWSNFVTNERTNEQGDSRSWMALKIQFCWQWQWQRLQYQPHRSYKCLSRKMIRCQVHFSASPICNRHLCLYKYNAVCFQQGHVSYIYFKVFFSSVRSSNSDPNLLVIQQYHPLFQITRVLNTGLSLSEPLQLYKGYNAV